MEERELEIKTGPSICHQDEEIEEGEIEGGYDQVILQF